MDTVLIVDDEDSLLEILARAIGRLGLGVFTAKTGLEAIELYKQNKPKCVLLDVKLPDIDGMEVFKKIKELDQQAKVYFISGSDNKDFKEVTRQMGASGYLVKPLILGDVIAIVENLSKSC